MLDGKGFDSFADEYDEYVNKSDDEGNYPFVGYKTVLNKIYDYVVNTSKKSVLDIGFGTACLTTRLYQNGCTIYGQDFSSRMIEIAQEKMPGAKLYQGDFSFGLSKQLLKQKYDVIIATYSLHHLTDNQKVDFLKSLLTLLNDDGCIYIGDISFETKTDLNKCMEEVKDEWDSEEIYIVFDELKKYFTSIQFEKISKCAGIVQLKK